MGRVGSVSQRAEGAALARAARPVPDRGNARYVRPRCALARAINNLSYGRSDLQNAPTGQGTISYGGRFGSARQFGVFVGGSYDRNNRMYDEVEATYGYKTLNGQQVIVPLTTSRREHLTQRKRSGLAFSTD